LETAFLGDAHVGFH
jgi:hypothetical protein